MFFYQTFYRPVSFLSIDQYILLSNYRPGLSYGYALSWQASGKKRFSYINRVTVLITQKKREKLSQNNLLIQAFSPEILLLISLLLFKCEHAQRLGLQ